MKCQSMPCSGSMILPARAHLVLSGGTAYRYINTGYTYHTSQALSNVLQTGYHDTIMKRTKIEKYEV